VDAGPSPGMTGGTAGKTVGTAGMTGGKKKQKTKEE